MKTKHTAGPWTKDGCGFIFGEDGSTVARTTSDGDLALIAAAPELADALKECLQQLARLAEKGEINGDAAHIVRARIALKKAGLL